jgi:hypothetical protein
MRLDHYYRSDLHLLPHRLAHYILKTLVSAAHKRRQELSLMPISIKSDPQLLGNRQNHMSILDTGLQYTTDLRHKIIRVPLGA